MTHPDVGYKNKSAEQTKQSSDRLPLLGPRFNGGGLARDAESEVGEDLAQQQQHEEKDDHRHDNDIVADARTDVEPAAVVTDEEEEMLGKQGYKQLRT